MPKDKQSSEGYRQKKWLKSNKENGKLTAPNKIRQTMITQDGNEQPFWRMTETCTGQFRNETRF